MLVTAGGYMWTVDKQRRLGELGHGLLVGVVVSLALFVVQRDADENLQKVTKHQESQLREADLRREQAQAKQNLQLELSRAPRVSGLSLERRDLADFALARKNVTESRFDYGRLDRVDFDHAVLWRVSAKHAQLRATWLEDADLRRAQLDDANFDGANLESADLRGASAVGANFTDAWMAKADLRDGTFLDSVEAPPPSAGADLVSLPPPPEVPRKATFVRAQMRRAVLSGLELAGIDFHDARLHNANLRDADLSRADLRGAKLDRADLRGARLFGATLCEASLNGARLGGTSYDATTRWPKGIRPPARGAVLDEPLALDAYLDSTYEEFDTADAGDAYPRC